MTSADERFEHGRPDAFLWLMRERDRERERERGGGRVFVNESVRTAREQ